MPTRIRIKASKHELTSNLSGEIRFWEQWNEHEAFLFALCQKWTRGSVLDPRELLSAGMLHAYEGARKRKEEIGNHRAWFAKVLRNFCLDHQRAQNRHPQIQLDYERLLPIFENQPKGQQISVEGSFIKEEHYRNLLGKVGELPESLREVMVLRACQNLSYREIALKLHISSANARKRVELARKHLRNTGNLIPNSKGKFKDEKAAVDAVLDRKRSLLPAHSFAQPQIQHLNHDTLPIELPIFYPRKPSRLSQRAATLEKYIEKHPGGWKKELEYSLLCWSQGQTVLALRILEGVFERHSHIVQVSLNYLKLLAELKEFQALKDACETLLENQRRYFEGNKYINLVEGFLAMAVGANEAALKAWSKGSNELIFGLRCQAYFASNQLRAGIKFCRGFLDRFPEQREPYFYLNGLETDVAVAVSYAEMAIEKFPDDPYANAFLFLQQLRSGYKARELSKSLSELDKMLGASSRLTLVCHWCFCECNGAEGVGNRYLSAVKTTFPDLGFLQIDATYTRSEKVLQMIRAIVFP